MALPLWLWLALIVGFDLLVAWLIISHGRAGTDQFQNPIPRLRRATPPAQKVADGEQVVRKIHLSDKHSNFFHGNLKDEGKIDLWDPAGGYWHGTLKSDNKIELFGPNGEHRYGKLGHRGKIELFSQQGDYWHGGVEA